MHADKLGQVTNFRPKWAALLSTASISTWFCFATVRYKVKMLCRAGYMLGFATHFQFNFVAASVVYSESESRGGNSRSLTRCDMQGAR